MANKDNFLIISDLHMPMHNSQAFYFLKNVAKDFDIPRCNVYCVGDELDQYNFSRWPKDPNARHTAIQEIECARDAVKSLAKIFPEMKICESNHGSRIAQTAMGAQLPSDVLKSIEEIFHYPEGWEIQDKFVVCANKAEFVVMHGDVEGWSGATGHIKAAMDNGLSTCIGHIHSHAGVNYIRKPMQEMWAMNVGALYDPKSYAFKYGAKHARKGTLGCGVVTDGGRMAIWLPL
jgi:hypothetical protein